MADVASTRRGGCRRGGALLLAATLAGCNIGDATPRCTLDPAELQAGASAGCSAPGQMTVSGTAFPWSECGATCPRPWTVTVRWTNQSNGAAGEQPLGWHTSSCWPFASSACGLDGFSVQVPVVPGLNVVELAADEGDGYTACQVIELVAPDLGC